MENERLYGEVGRVRRGVGSKEGGKEESVEEEEKKREEFWVG